MTQAATFIVVDRGMPDLISSALAILARCWSNGVMTMHGPAAAVLVQLQQRPLTIVA